jgi:23S rRNA U2552 (ribose-2'-O)-methylase RlmE/FtsJ
METLETIFNRHWPSTDKGKHHHNYTRQYEGLLRDYRDKPIKYLEIGVFKGGSIKAFREAFEKSVCILGVDINPDCKNHQDIGRNIYIEIGNATDANFIKEITEKYGRFDVIMDDGSHHNSDVIKTFELLFPLLNDNGLYIVEDTNIYKTENYIDSNYDDHLTYFYRYTKFLNQTRIDNSTEGIRDWCGDPFKILKKTDNVFEYSIDKIEYGCSYIAISKRLRYHWIK